VAGTALVAALGAADPGQAQPTAPRTPGATSPDAVERAQATRAVPAERPEPRKTERDRSDVSAATRAKPSSPALKGQPDQGKMAGFDSYRDPLGSKRPMMAFEKIMRDDVAAKPKVMADPRRLLESRYEPVAEARPRG
jgi:hypothetical protein